MKLNKDQKTFFPFLHSTLFLIALFLSVLISKRLYFNDDDIVYSREPTVTTIEPYTTRIYTGPTSSACNVTKINDGICQDETNIPECGFDGGDCCIPQSIMQFKECQACECHESIQIPFSPYCSLRDLGNLHSNSFLGYYNDGYCDDNLNNYVCNFDGGDCCRNTSIFTYCSDCSCIWDVTNYPILTTSNTRCDIAGDGFCDDATNDARCNFDGGDCCIPDKNTKYCVFCTCWADQPQACWSQSNINNGLCDGITNTPICDYDGGDCCLTEVDLSNCKSFECVCHEDGLIHYEPPTEVCDATIIGNGICDDLTNTYNCNFDGGDCCIPSSDTSFCSFYCCSPNSNINYCSFCQCLTEDNYITSSTPTTKSEVCYDTYAIGDSICDDNLNILACNYDDGDCCFGIKGVNCMACICKDNYTHHPVITTPASVCFADESILGDGVCDYEAATPTCMYDNGDCWDCMSTFIHDGICDDNNNREECDWDGFDCCLEDIYIIDEYCNECLCHLDDENNNTSTEKGVPP